MEMHGLLRRRIVSGVLLALTLAAILSRGGWAVPAAPTGAASAAPSAVLTAAVTPQEQAAVGVVIHKLFDAYAHRDLEMVMSLEKRFIDKTAADYEKRGKGKADDWRQALRGCTDDVLRHKDFAMKPLHLDGVDYHRRGSVIIVSSVVPIIATEAVEVGDPGSGTKAKLRIGKVVLEPVPGGGYEIVDMHLY